MEPIARSRRVGRLLFLASLGSIFSFFLSYMLFYIVVPFDLSRNLPLILLLSVPYLFDLVCRITVIVLFPFFYALHEHSSETLKKWDKVGFFLLYSSLVLSLGSTFFVSFGLAFLNWLAVPWGVMRFLLIFIAEPFDVLIPLAMGLGTFWLALCIRRMRVIRYARTIAWSFWVVGGIALFSCVLSLFNDLARQVMPKNSVLAPLIELLNNPQISAGIATTQTFLFQIAPYPLLCALAFSGYALLRTVEQPKDEPMLIQQDTSQNFRVDR
uniref:Uncharacterized protein n=1 Tax=Thermosporothrix sp. COM3 TaxID=2490863 RepID=A0A455SEL7_9CHLR|nr:hypothetical protein KTC_16680 [Thermosporothrix sp. COM3]